MNNLAKVLIEQDKNVDAMALCQQRLAVQANDLTALNILGVCQMRLANAELSLATFDTILEIAPNDANTLNNRGAVLIKLGQIGEALTSLDRAISLDPNYVDALINRAVVWWYRKDFNNELADYERILRVHPTHKNVMSKMLRAKLELCQWNDYDLLAARLVRDVLSGEKLCNPLTMVAVAGSTKTQLKCAQTWIDDKCCGTGVREFSIEILGREKIRIAYISPDFGDHPVGHLAVGLFEAHDRSRFEITGVSLTSRHETDIGTRLFNAFDNIVEAEKMSDLEVSNYLRESRIDIAVDLAGHTRGGRTEIFAFHPAPIQVNFLGFPGTMGAEFYEYIVADEHTIPAEFSNNYVENIVYLPASFLPFDDKQKVAAIAPDRADLGLPENGFVFCCLNNAHKITPQVFAIWMRLLGQIEGSVLWLRGGNETTHENLRSEATRAGVQPERLIFSKRIERHEDYIAAYRCADLFLDTFNYNAHTTSCESLWAGTPVLTFSGEAFASRVAGSLLKAVGLPELVTGCPEDYENLAIELATNPAKLSGIKQKLVENRKIHPLFNTDQYTRNIEAAYSMMVDRHDRGLPPKNLVIAH